MLPLLPIQPPPDQSYQISIDYSDNRQPPAMPSDNAYINSLPLMPQPPQLIPHSNLPLANSRPTELADFSGNIIELPSTTIYHQSNQLRDTVAQPPPTMAYANNLQSYESEIFNEYVNNPYNCTEAASESAPVSVAYNIGQYADTLASSFTPIDDHHRPQMGSANVFQSANYFGAVDGQDMKIPPGSEMLFSAAKLSNINQDLSGKTQDGV